ncbi:hypothetical protein OH76DRAFT_1482964 [Lentinus brumalis]|uniref:Uncharacterized protein n=1 Tax=Lentinus brumalis TaxID=2498619 RepID=A0A371DAN6_9APHY|nr:hypothetical protein OH76DRAFT_1482964 [Polyporus brumalis]
MVQYVRNHYRKVLKESLFSPGRCGLTKFVNTVISKFDPDRKPTLDFVIRLVVLRHFCLENPAALDCEDLVEWFPPEHLASMHPPKTGKCKREGRPFWELAQEYIENKILENGEDLSSDKWRTYLSKAIQEEQKLFPDDQLPLLPQLRVPPPVAFSAPNSEDLTVPNFGSPDDMLGTVTTNATQMNDAGQPEHVRSLSRSSMSSPFSPSPVLRASEFGSPRTPASTLSSIPPASFLPQASGHIPHSSVHLPRLPELAQAPANNFGMQLCPDIPDAAAPTSRSSRLAPRQPSTRLNVSAGARSGSAAAVSLSQVTDPDAHAFDFDIGGQSLLSQGSHRLW